MLLLDQRGTGRSTPVGAYDDIPGNDVHAKAAHLTHFRADAIVRDCELLREHLGVERWSLLGQSFGGFTSTTYLCLAPESLRSVHVTGGLPPVGVGPDEVYAATFDRMVELSHRHHRRFPDDGDRLRRALDAARAGRVRLPGGVTLSPERIRSLGNKLGMDGGSEQIHHLLELDPTSPAFASDVAAGVPFTPRNPIYTFLHESSCSDGHPTRWSAERIRPAAYDDDETLLTGEHLFRWHFEQVPGLEQYAELADVLAEHPWPRLYDEDALRRADVPVAAAVYCRRPVRAARALPRGRRPAAACRAVDHQRVAAQRAAGLGRGRPRPADRDRPPRLTRTGGGRGQLDGGRTRPATLTRLRSRRSWSSTGRAR